MCRLKSQLTKTKSIVDKLRSLFSTVFFMLSTSSNAYTSSILGICLKLFVIDLSNYCFLAALPMPSEELSSNFFNLPPPVHQMPPRMRPPVGYGGPPMPMMPRPPMPMMGKCCGSSLKCCGETKLLRCLSVLASNSLLEALRSRAELYLLYCC